MADGKYHFQVEPQSFYIEEQSDVVGDLYVFGYHIRITNTGTVPAQLVSRYWVITDANNQIQEVRGMGVVGKRPNLAPGDVFEYSSATSLKTPYGAMRGTYQIVASDGAQFEAEIPEMVLVAKRILH